MSSQDKMPNEPADSPCDDMMSEAIYRLGARRHVLNSLRLMIDNHTLVSISDLNGCIIYVNDRFCEVSQYSREELVGQKHELIRSNHHPTEFYEQIWEVLRSGNVWTGDMKNRAKDGSHYWVQCTASPIFDDANTIVGYGSVRTDVSAQRTAMAVLEDSGRRAQETLRSAINVLDSGVKIFDSNSTLIISNKKAAEMYPEANDLLAPGNNASAILSRVTPELSPEEVEQKVADAFSHEFHTYRRLSDGRHVRITRSPTPEGGLIAVHTDITDLMEQKESRERQAATLDLMMAIAVAANESEDADTAYTACLALICKYADWQVGHTYLLNEGKFDICHSGNSWYSSDEAQFRPFREVSDGIHYTVGVGLPGTVLASGKPEWVHDVTVRDDFPRAKPAERCGLIGGAAFPVRVRNEIVAVLEFFATRPLEYSPELSEIMSHVCTQVGRVAERERAEKQFVTRVNDELRRRDKELIEQNERFEAALKNMSQGICVFDADKRLIVANQRYGEIYGLDPKLLVPGTPLKAILEERVKNGVFAAGTPEDYYKERFSWAERGKQSNTVQHLTDGRVVAITHQPMDGGGWLTTHEDITERIESEKELQESRELLSKAFRASPAAMAISDTEDGSHLEVNDTWCKTLGYTHQDAMRHSALELEIWANPEDRKQFISILKETGSVYGFEAKFRRKDGKYLDVITAGELVEVGGKRHLLIVWHDITERKKAERAREESQNLFIMAFRASPAAMGISIPEDGTHLDVNEAWSKMLGYTHEEGLSNSAVELGLWVNIQARTDFVTKLMEEGSVRDFQTKYRKKDGELIDVINSGETVEIDGKKRLLIVAHDITERKKAERELRESEERFKSLVETTNVVPWEFDPAQECYTYVGPQVVSMFGYSVEKWLEPNFWQSIIHPDDRDLALKTSLETAQRCQDHDFEYRIISESGEERWVRDVVSVIAEEGAPVGLRGVLIDVSERVKARLALEQSELRFKDIVEVSSDWIWECDEQLRFTYFSDRFAEITGIPKTEVLGKTRREFATDSSANWEEHLADMDARRPFRNFCYSANGPKGIQHWSVSGRPVFNAEGRFKGYRGTGYDRTEQVLAEAELIRHRDHLQEMVNEATGQLKQQAEELKHALAKEKELNEMQRQFLSMASHEFRTPLAIIDSSAQRLLRKEAADQDQRFRRRVDKIRTAVSRMTQLMESTLAAARIEGGKASLKLEDVDIVQIIRHVCDQHTEIANGYDISFRIEALPQSITADPAALEQIFTNLLSNAVKYSPDASDIDISATCEDDHVLITVKDYGVGIDPEDIPKMFQRFFRARTASGIAGTGIGLNLVKTLIELHGGSISVQSEPGAGSEFTVKLPVGGPNVAGVGQEEAA